MEDDDDDFFAFQTAKSLDKKRTQLKQFFQAPVTSRKLSSSSNSDFDNENENENALLSIKISKSTPATIPIPIEIIEKKNLIKNEIDAIVTSCYNSANKEAKRKLKLEKRTAADDQKCEDDDDYIADITHQNRNRPMSRAKLNSLNKSSLEDDDEKVTRETAAYERLDAVLRVTKPLYEKKNKSIDDDDDVQSNSVNNMETNTPIQSLLFNTITLVIDHSDGRQLNLSIPSSTTLQNLYNKVAERLSLPSIYLVHNDQTLKLDDKNRSMTLQQLNFSTADIELLESYPLVRKINIFIQTSSSLDRRSPLASKRQYTIMESDRFEILFEAYKRDVKKDHIRFEFDGDTIHPHATPIDYDMIDGEILDAFIVSESIHSNDQKS